MSTCKTFVSVVLSIAFGIGLVLCPGIGNAQLAADGSIPALEKRGQVTQLIVDGKPMLMLAGELHNSSPSNAEYMRPIWKNLTDMNLNTVIGAVSWELM